MERLPDAELEVMQALWRQEKYPVSSAALMEELAGRRWQTATLLKLLSRLEERGFVKREKEGRNNLYTPLVRREDYLSAESRAFLQRLHGGSLPSLVAAHGQPGHLPAGSGGAGGDSERGGRRCVSSCPACLR